MQIDEIIRSCRSESVAHAAVASLGPRFVREVEFAARARGMSVGRFASHSVASFARRGDEKQMRAVRTAMTKAQQPVLAGLEHIIALGMSAHAA